MSKEQKKMLGTFGCQLVSRAGQYEQAGFLGMKWMPIFGTIGSRVPKICIDPSVSGRKSQTVFPLGGQSGFGGVGCHVCILAKKYCLRKRKKSSSGEIFGYFKQ